jgi:hypothetical protein
VGFQRVICQLFHLAEIETKLPPIGPRNDDRCAERIGICPVMNAERPAVQLDWL